MDAIDKKLDAVRRAVRGTGGLVVAFSGGVDSTLLAHIAQEELGERALAVTALSPTYPAHEQNEAASIAAALGIRHETVVSDELEIPGFSENTKDRCFFCKSELFMTIRLLAEKHGIEAIADGSNADDLGDYRPGRRAACDAGVLSPLLDAGLGKAEIRELSRRFGLPTAEKPAFACLASRFPYGDRITAEKLKQVDAVEGTLRALGFRQFRVRHHGQVARIEVEPDQIGSLCETATRERIVAAAKSAGFLYVAADLQGYRTGSMNEALDVKQAIPLPGNL